MILSARRRFSVALPALALALLVFPACDSVVEPVPSTDTVRFGVNFTTLFGAPTADEVASVRAEWTARTPTATGIQVVGPAIGPDGSQLYVVSHLITAGPGGGGTARHFGLVRVPPGAVNLPVLVMHHGGDQGTGTFDPTANSGLFAQRAAFPALFNQTVQVLPSYRAEPLRTNGFEAVLGTGLVSGGTPSPWDFDVDDSMALLSAVLARDEFAGATDGSRVGAIGFSRGANVALLHSIRDPRVDAVVNYYGPSDFYNPVTEDLAASLLGGFPRALQLPGGPFLLANVLRPLQGPNATENPSLDYARGRRDVIRRSASLFTAQMRNVQVHHHQTDAVVPVPISQAFNARAQAARPQGAYSFTVYSNALPDGVSSTHNAEAMPASLTATEAFMQANLIGQTRMPLIVRR